MLGLLNRIILTILISIITTLSFADDQHSHGANTNYLKVLGSSPSYLVTTFSTLS